MPGFPPTTILLAFVTVPVYQYPHRLPACSLLLPVAKGQHSPVPLSPNANTLLQVAVLCETVPVAGRRFAGMCVVDQHLFQAKGKLILKALVKGAKP